MVDEVARRRFVQIAGAIARSHGRFVQAMVDLNDAANTQHALLDAQLDALERVGGQTTDSTLIRNEVAAAMATFTGAADQVEAVMHHLDDAAVRVARLVGALQ